MSLGKAWWNRVMFGLQNHEAEPKRATPPGPIALTLAVLALVAFFAWPAAHEGLSAVISSWHPYSNGNVKEYQRMAREAEVNHDAKTLAFVASRLGSLQENTRAVNKAVEIDPSLAWIYVRGSDSRFVFVHVPQSQNWIPKLEAFDPDNAVVYLTDASIRSSEMLLQSNYQLSPATLINDSAWRAAMEKAFAAPRYDSYYDRALELQQSELKAHNLTAPQDIACGIVEYYSSGVFEAQKYADYLLRQAKEAQQKGDAATATRLAWTVAQFADRARASMHNEAARGTTEGMLYSAAIILIPLEAAAGHIEAAKLLTIEKESYDRKLAAKTPYRIPYDDRPMNATGIALQIAGLGIVLFGGLIGLSLVFLLASRFAPGMRERTLYRWACQCSRFGPMGFAAAVGMVAALYAPYMSHMQDFLAGVKDTQTLQALTGMYSAISSMPSAFFNPMHAASHHFYLWISLIIASILGGAIFLGRDAWHSSESRGMKVA